MDKRTAVFCGKFSIWQLKEARQPYDDFAAYGWLMKQQYRSNPELLRDPF
jgi:hypothetical protein